MSCYPQNRLSGNISGANKESQTWKNIISHLVAAVQASLLRNRNSVWCEFAHNVKNQALISNLWLQEGNKKGDSDSQSEKMLLTASPLAQSLQKLCTV